MAVPAGAEVTSRVIPSAATGGTTSCECLSSGASTRHLHVKLNNCGRHNTSEMDALGPRASASRSGGGVRSRALRADHVNLIQISRRHVAPGRLDERRAFHVSKSALIREALPAIREARKLPLTSGGEAGCRSSRRRPRKSSGRRSNLALLHPDERPDLSSSTASTRNLLGRGSGTVRPPARPA